MSAYIKIENCLECPNLKTVRTPHSFQANGYYCNITGDKIAGYIEQPSKMPDVPEDCPIRFNG